MQSLMMGMNIEDAVRSTVARRLEVEADRLHLEADLFDDLGGDAGTAAIVLLELEDTFQVTIDGDEAGGMRTIADLVQCLTAIVARR